MSTDPTIYVVGLSQYYSDADVATATAAVHKQVRDHLAPAWGIEPRPIVYVPDTGSVSATQAVVVVQDDAPSSNYLAAHSQNTQRVYGIVGTRDIYQAGIGALTGKYCMAHLLSHEVLEMIVDPWCRSWIDTSSAGSGPMLAEEICDATQSDFYNLDGVSVSNFCLPGWFNWATPSTEATDYMGNLKGPFKLRAGGYKIQRTAGTKTTVYGAKIGEHPDAIPQWVRDRKERNPHSRTGRRHEHRKAEHGR